MDDIDVADKVEVAPLRGAMCIRFEPIKAVGRTFDHIVLREPSTGALVDVRKQVDPIAQMAVLIASCSDLPLAAVRGLPNSVFRVACDFLESHLRTWLYLRNF